MKTQSHISLLIILLSLMFGGEARAQSWKSSLHIVGSPAIQLDARPQGFDSSVAQDEDDSTLLIWGRRKQKSKVTVSTFSPGQRFELTIEAASTRNGKSTGSIKLVDGMMDTDLIVNIQKKKAGLARLRYVANVTLEQGNTETEFADVHTVTYTITDQ